MQYPVFSQRGSIFILTWVMREASYRPERQTEETNQYIAIFRKMSLHFTTKENKDDPEEAKNECSYFPKALDR